MRGMKRILSSKNSRCPFLFFSFETQFKIRLLIRVVWKSSSERGLLPLSLLQFRASRKVTLRRSTLVRLSCSPPFSLSGACARYKAENAWANRLPRENRLAVRNPHPLLPLTARDNEGLECLEPKTPAKGPLATDDARQRDPAKGILSATDGLLFRAIYSWLRAGDSVLIARDTGTRVPARDRGSKQ